MKARVRLEDHCGDVVGVRKKSPDCQKGVPSADRGAEIWWGTRTRCFPAVRTLCVRIDSKSVQVTFPGGNVIYRDQIGMRRGNSSRGRADRSSSRNNAVAGPSRRHENEIYDDLLEEALRHGPRADNDRPLKKRKSRRDPNDIIVIDDSASAAEDVVSENQREVFFVESSQNSTDNEDEMEWDDVDLTALPTSEGTQEIGPAPTVREVTLNAQPRKPLYSRIQFF